MTDDVQALQPLSELPRFEVIDILLMQDRPIGLSLRPARRQHEVPICRQSGAFEGFVKLRGLVMVALDRIRQVIDEPKRDLLLLARAPRFSTSSRIHRT